MLIRSQNKETLLNMDRVTTVELGVNGLKIVADTDDTVFQMPQDSNVRTRKELLLEKLEQRVRTMITTRTLDSKVVSEKFLYFGDVKSIVEEVMSNE